MYSLPSTSQTWLPWARCRKFGTVPKPHWRGDLPKVCVPTGIARTARSQSSSERVRSSDMAIVASPLSLSRNECLVPAEQRQLPLVERDRVAPGRGHEVAAELGLRELLVAPAEGVEQ